MPEISVTHIPDWIFCLNSDLTYSFCICWDMKTSPQWLVKGKSQFSYNVAVFTLHAHTCVYTTVQIDCAEGWRALSCLPWCVWFLCCGVGITRGINRILAATRRWDRDDRSHHVVSRFNPSLLPGLKAAQTADYMSTTAGEEVTHRTAEIRLNKLFFGCLGVFNPNTESCLSWLSLGWIRKLQTAFFCKRI